MLKQKKGGEGGQYKWHCPWLDYKDNAAAAAATRVLGSVNSDHNENMGMLSAGAWCSCHDPRRIRLFCKLLQYQVDLWIPFGFPLGS